MDKLICDNKDCPNFEVEYNFIYPLEIVECGGCQKVFMIEKTE